MSRLLIVHHTPSPAMADAVLPGTPAGIGHRPGALPAAEIGELV